MSEFGLEDKVTHAVPPGGGLVIVGTVTEINHVSDPEGQRCEYYVQWHRGHEADGWYTADELKAA